MLSTQQNMVLVGEACPVSGLDMFDSSDEECGEVDQTPFQVDWLDLSCYGCAENLGISGLPGCRFKETWRNLHADIATLRALQVKDVFTLCSQGELHKYRVPCLLSEFGRAELALHHSPFPDGQTPSMGQMLKMVDEIHVNLMQGRKTLVHCFGGLGRSCLVAGCLLMVLDPTLGADAVIEKLRVLRGPGAIQSVKQYNFLHDFREDAEKFEKNRQEVARSVSR